MTYLKVDEVSKGKFGVFINFIQRGIAYSSMELAKSEEHKLEEQFLARGIPFMVVK